MRDPVWAVSRAALCIPLHIFRRSLHQVSFEKNELSKYYTVLIELDALTGFLGTMWIVTRNGALPGVKILQLIPGAGSI